MKVVDLSHTIQNGMQIYPGDPQPVIQKYITHEKDYCHVDQIILGTHTGTHIDAPYHFLKEGKKMDEIPVERFIGEGVLVDVSHKTLEAPINEEDIRGYASLVKEKDFVVFRTGWDRYFGTDQYLKHPYLTPSCAALLVSWGVGIVAIDALNVDPTLKAEYPVHDILLRNDVLIVENLWNLDKISQKRGMYFFLPLKLQATDGSPIRALYMQL